MKVLALFAVMVSAVFYSLLALRLRRDGRAGPEFLPSTGKHGHVTSAKEFAAATVATTISLATVLIALFELYSSLRLWLFWTVLTTLLGLLLVRLLARRIWSMFVPHSERPTIHGFLGAALSSPGLRTLAAACSVLGFLGAFAVEVTVGSNFLALFLPSASAHVWTSAVTVCVLLPILIAGYRAVVVTEQYQMFSIYACLLALSLLLIPKMVVNSGHSDHYLITSLNPTSLFPWSAETVAFLVGIFFINVPAFLADMSLWQRMTASVDEVTVLRGLTKSALGAAASWSWIALLAGCAFLATSGEGAGSGLLASTLTQLQNPSNLGTQVLLFVVMLGLFAALLSTAATQLMAAVQAIHDDILHLWIPPRRAEAPFGSTGFRLRVLTVAIAALAIAAISLLESRGMTIADLVFAIYGAQLSLFPTVVCCLVVTKAGMARLRTFAIVSIPLGFLVGWAAAIAGRLVEQQTITFLAPVASLTVSLAVVALGFVWRTNEPGTSLQNR